ncbi:MAG: glutamine--fructose-6-phosphate transaminase (isomerizing) [SAR202 cluster bacterium]|nr:glutamine--fructose-6-phosphate transaminase (isomerizing) [SAR202 cluster bacterium]
MCGIVGYAGHRQAWPLILEGLQRLEYRGYDSAGVVTLQPPRPLEFHQAVGKVSHLVASLNGSSPEGVLGLGHTRWATHGRPSVANAHPHTDCKRAVAVVHNGIVENFLALKQDLISKGHKFSSETDSEVIPHLLEEGLANEEGFEQAFRRMASFIKGANAVVAMCQSEPGKLFALRLGNAGGIAVAKMQGETILASDIPALITFSNQVTFLESGEIAVASADSVRYLDIQGKTLSKRAQVIPQEWAAIGKDGYRHFMLKEIMEQPQAIASAFRGQVDFQAGRVELENFPISQPDLRKLKKVFLVGCGTSLHAAMVGRHFIEGIAQLPAEAESASEFRYRNPVVDKDTLVVSIGQSGETADTLAAMEYVKRRGARLITICNNEGSQASRLAEGTLYMRSGPEMAVASTKTFMASLSLLALLAVYLGQSRGSLSAEEQARLLAELARLPNLLGEVLSHQKLYKKLARDLYKYNHLLYLGRGILQPIALEGALKLKEVSYIHAEGYAAGEMKHGPIAIIDDKLATVALAPRNDLYEKMLNNIKEVKARDGLVLAVAAQGDQAIAAEVDHVAYIPQTSELSTPFLAAAPLQLLAYYIAVQRGCDVDQPRNLAKSVTVE